MSSSASDAEAISRSLRDPVAFVAAFDRHFDVIHRYLSRRVGKEVADELAAETVPARGAM